MMDAIKKESLEVRIFTNRQILGERAAEAACEKILQLLDKQPMVNIMFAAAPSQNEFLQWLATKKRIDWSRINAFHMDEYLNLPADAPQGFGNFLKERLFARLPFRSVNYINGNAPLVDQECKRYSQLLEEYPLDIVCMGIGENGHLAFNDPPVADFNDPYMVKLVELDERCRQQQVNDGCFDQLADVPSRALTVTIPPLMSARYIYCMVPGSTKAHAIFDTVNKNIDEQYPSTILRTHPNAMLFLDTASSALLG